MRDEDPVDFKAGIEEECKKSHCASLQAAMDKCAADVRTLPSQPPSEPFTARRGYARGSEPDLGRAAFDRSLATMPINSCETAEGRMC